MLIVVAISAALVGCGGDDDTRYGDAKIIDKLKLEELEGEKDYAIEGDLFCSVERELLNTSSEVEDAVEAEEIHLVVSSREGNVGVVGVPFFANDCRETARKKLNKLDP